MADKNDVVILNLDRARMVWFGHKALKTLGALTGKNINDIAESLQNTDFEDIEKIIYCGLLTDAKRNNETLKLEDMEDLLDFAPYSEITRCLQEGLTYSLGANEEEPKNQQGIVAKKK